MTSDSLMVAFAFGAVLLVGAAVEALGAKAPKPRPRTELEAALAKAPKPQAAESLRPLHVVLLADKKDHGPGAHDYPCWQKRWAVLLGGKGAGGSTATQVNLHGTPLGGQDALAGAPRVKVTTAWQWPSKEQLASADLIAMFCYHSGGKPRTWSEARVADLEAYLARGGGVVLIHSATYTVRNLSDAVGKRVLAAMGLAFDRTIRVRHGAIELKITAPDHPICLGLPETVGFHDEPYWPPVGDVSKVAVLATSDEAVKKGSGHRTPQPMFWTYKTGKGRVYACVLGHFNWTFDDPYCRILLLRGMAWAAGESPYRFDPLVLRGARVE